MTEDLDRVKKLAPDLVKGFPRSPRDTSIGGFVMAARALDKCRAVLCGTNGEYHYNCPLDKNFFRFAGIASEDFKALVATGASDTEVSAWVIAHATQQDREAVATWNTRECDQKMPSYMDDYIRNHLPPGIVLHHYFDLYDFEEGRL